MPTHLTRSALVGALALATVAAGAPAAQAVHWPFFGGDNGRSGYQPVDEGVLPLRAVYEKSMPTEQFVKTSIVTSSGSPATQRMEYGTRDGFVHLQVLGTGAPVGPEEGIDILEAVETDAERDVFGARSTVPGANGGSVSFGSTSTAAGLGQLLAVHNDDDDTAGAADIEIAQIDEASGTRVRADVDVAGTDGFTVNSSLVATGPAADGSRLLFFVASRDSDPSDARLFRVPLVGNAAASSSTVNGAAATNSGDIDATPLASPTLAFFDVAGTPTPFIVVGANGAVRSFRAADVSVAGPSFPAAGQVFQTPSVPVMPDGFTPNPGGAVKTAPFVYVAAANGTGTTVHKLRLSGSVLESVRMRDLAGRPAPALAVEQESEPTLTEAKIIVTTGENLFLLETAELAPAGQLSSTPLSAGTTGFAQTTAAASGDFGYVTRDNADQVVFRISDGSAVTGSEFPESASNVDRPNTGVGQPSITRGFIQYSGGSGVFVYRNTDATAPKVAVTAPAEGSTATGTVTITAQASDSRGITSVEFRVDDRPVGTDTAPDSGSPFGAGATYSTAFDTTTLSDGTHTITAVATDPTGLQTTSATRSITVSNGRSTSPSPSAPSSPAGNAACQGPETVQLDRSTITATGAAQVTVTGTPNSVIDLLAYTRPSTTFRVVRSAEIGADGVARFTIVPPANTRLYAQQRGCDQGPSVVLNVRTALSLAVERTGVRTYRFSGDSLPARAGGLIVSLYRITSSGQEVLTSQVRADARNGEWTINRRFTGIGRFGFVVRTGQDLQNAPGASNVRSLLVF